MEQNLTLDMDECFNVSYRWVILGSLGNDSDFQMTSYWSNAEVDVLDPTNNLIMLI